MSHCTNCGTPLEPGDRFCKNCGALQENTRADLNANPNVENIAEKSMVQPELPSKKKRRGLFIGLGVGLLLLLAGGIALFFFLGSGEPIVGSWRLDEYQKEGEGAVQVDDKKRYEINDKGEIPGVITIKKEGTALTRLQAKTTGTVVMQWVKKANAGSDADEYQLTYKDDNDSKTCTITATDGIIMIHDGDMKYTYRGVSDQEVVLLADGYKPAEPSSEPTPAPTPVPTPAPTPVPTPVPGPVTSFEEMINNGASRYYSYGELSNKSKEDLTLLLNGIYAHSGHIFDMDKFQQYFAQFSWYTPVTRDDEVVQNNFNAYQRANFDLILQVQRDLGYR